MKKKLYFDNRIDLDIDFYIEIDGGKIKRFVGVNMHDMFIMAVLDSGQIAQKDIRKIDIHISSKFTIDKLTKYDKTKLGTKANYKINSKEISDYTLRGAYIKLNLFEKFAIDYTTKQTIFHKAKISELIIIGLFVTLPIGLLIAYLSNPNIFQKNSPNPNLKIINQDSINAIKKATNVSTKAIKLDLDTLSRK